MRDKENRRIMRRKIQSFVVEIKRKRGNQGTRHSLWSDVDLAAFSGRATEVETAQYQGSRPVDSGQVHNDAGEGQQTRTEHIMADPQEVEAVPVVTEDPAKVEVPEPKQKTPRQKRAKAEKPKAEKAKAAPVQLARKGKAKEAAEPAAAPVAAVQGKRKTYSEKERTQKLTQIDRSVGRGESIRNAVKLAGISEQTYYHWKKAATSTPAAAPTGGELQDLLALEKENERLKKQLADQLRKENAQLKKKLGLA